MEKELIQYKRREYNAESQTIDLINLEGKVVESFYIFEMVAQAMENSERIKYELE